MIELYAIRHASAAEGDYPNSERPLSEVGRAHAEQLAERLARLGVAAIYTSPYRRAVETIAPLTRITSIPAEVVDSLRESAKDEELPAVRDRMVATVASIVAERESGVVVICTHGGTLWGLISHFEPAFTYEQYRLIKTPDVKRFVYNGTSGEFDSAYLMDPL